MTTYTCPTCDETMEKDLLLFMRHTDEHVRQTLEENSRRKAGRYQISLFKKTFALNIFF